MSSPSKWKIVWSNGEEETTNRLGYLRPSVSSDYLFEEDHNHNVVRTIVMANVRSWEAVE